VSQSPDSEVSLEMIGHQIIWLRGRKVLLDVHLAKLYGVSTARLNEQVKRNAERFPLDFVFRLENHEFRLLISQIATSKGGRGGRRKNPLAFTEHGALMAAAVLNSSHAIQVSVYVIRAFVRLRETLASHRYLATKLEEVERKAAALASKHDALAAETHAQFKEIIDALRRLMSSTTQNRRPIGFITPK
jgi:hypothetical protein